MEAGGSPIAALRYYHQLSDEGPPKIQRNRYADSRGIYLYIMERERELHLEATLIQNAIQFLLVAVTADQS